MKNSLFISLLIFSGCAMPPKSVCSDLSHVDQGGFIHLDEDKEFDRQQGLCKDVYKTPMNRSEFHKRFLVGRAKDLKVLCTCENGYVDKVKNKSEVPPVHEGLALSQLCKEVQLDLVYLKGTKLAERDLKTFKPNYWSGPTDLTRAEGEKACRNSSAD